MRMRSHRENVGSTEFSVLMGQEVIGVAACIRGVGPRAVEIGYWVAASHTRRGIARSATAELTRLAFASPEVDHIDIRCEPRNEVSARVASGLGYRLIETQAEASAPTADGAEASPLETWRMTRRVSRTVNGLCRGIRRVTGRASASAAHTRQASRIRSLGRPAFKPQS